MWAAQQLARLTGDEVYDITTLNELPNMDSARQIGFVFSVYAWGAPEIMAEFAKKLRLHLRRLHLRWGRRPCYEAVFQVIPAEQQL